MVDNIRAGAPPQLQTEADSQPPSRGIFQLQCAQIVNHADRPVARRLEDLMNLRADGSWTLATKVEFYSEKANAIERLVTQLPPEDGDSLQMAALVLGGCASEVRERADLLLSLSVTFPGKTAHGVAAIDAPTAQHLAERCESQAVEVEKRWTEKFLLPEVEDVLRGKMPRLDEGGVLVKFKAFKIALILGDLSPQERSPRVLAHMRQGVEVAIHALDALRLQAIEELGRVEHDPASPGRDKNFTALALSLSELDHMIADTRDIEKRITTPASTSGSRGLHFVPNPQPQLVAPGRTGMRIRR